LRILKAVVKKRPGKTVFKAGIMTRILQSGWVRAGDLVKVLAPDVILSKAKDDTLSGANG
jgi:MOSC domain-containing protein YiiM